MKLKRTAWWPGLLLCLLLAACNPEQQQATVMAVTPTAVTPTAQPPPSALPASATPTPAPATVTATPPPTPTSAPPFAAGRIIFRWRPVPIPSEPDQPYPEEPRSSLYMAVAGAGPEDWTIQPLLENIGFFPQTFLSPDQTKLAILVSTYSERYYNDFSIIHIYTFADGSLIPLQNQHYLRELSWLPDGQAVVYAQLSNIELARLDGSPPEQLTDNPLRPIEGEPYSAIRQLVGSPDGSLLALDVTTGIGVANSGLRLTSRDLMFFDIAQRDFVHAIEHSVIHAFAMHWSPDSQWLAFTDDYDEGLFLLNAQTYRIQQLLEPVYSTVPIWSPDSQQLAFTVNGILHLWDARTQIVTEVTRKDTLSQAAWMPDGSLLAAGYSLGSEAGILFINRDTLMEQLLPLDMVTSQLIWSPDGQWLTGIFGSTSRTGLFVVNRNNGQAHFLLDTAGFAPPTSIIWLP
jgi:WD40 repeat protein